jgi:hypothetical protein
MPGYITGEETVDIFVTPVVKIMHSDHNSFGRKYLPLTSC